METRKQGYDTDLTDSAWEVIAPVLPEARSDGRPQSTNLRRVVNAILYLLPTGCPWRLLPLQFPAWGTVYSYFRSWEAAGVWVQLHRTVYRIAKRQNRQEKRIILTDVDQFSEDEIAQHPLEPILIDMESDERFPSSESPSKDYEYRVQTSKLSSRLLQPASCCRRVPA